MQKPSKELCQKNLRSTAKHGGANVMIWGSMAYNGTGSIAFIIDTMTATKYIEVLRDNLPLIATLLGLSATYHFQQDNDPKQTAWDTRM